MEPTKDVMCPTCGIAMVDGTCPQCGAKAETTPAPETTTETTPEATPETTPEVAPEVTPEA